MYAAVLYVDAAKASELKTHNGAKDDALGLAIIDSSFSKAFQASPCRQQGLACEQVLLVARPEPPYAVLLGCMQLQFARDVESSKLAKGFNDMLRPKLL